MIKEDESGLAAKMAAAAKLKRQATTRDMTKEAAAAAEKAGGEKEGAGSPGRDNKAESPEGDKDEATTGDGRRMSLRGEPADGRRAGAVNDGMELQGSAERRAAINVSGGIRQLIRMVDPANAPKSEGGGG